MITINHNIITVDDYSVTQKLDGNNALKFQINVNNENYSLIKEREIVKADGQMYRITAIDMDLSNANVTAEICWEKVSNQNANWKGTAIEDFTTGTPVLLSQAIQQILPNGWRLTLYNSSSKRRLVKCDGVLSKYGILQKMHDFFDFAVQINNKDGVIMVYQDPATYQPSTDPAIVMDGLNLERLEYKGKASDYFTVLYAEGKDGLTFGAINDGKNYVENKTYNGETIVAYWKDERYTNMESLLEDATAKLQNAAFPNVTYTCSIRDLYALDNTSYADLRLGLLSIVRIIDSVKDVSIDMKVTEYETHPLNPEKNVITMSSTIQQVKGLTQTINDAVAEEATVRKTEVDIAFEKMQEIIDNSSGLYCTKVTDAGGASIYYLHDQPALADSTIIWRMAADIVSVSTNGGSTWNAGITATGQVIADRLSVVGIDAEWIRIGKIAESQLAAAVVSKIDSNITGVSVQYAKNQSNTTPPTTGWQDNAPAWEEGYYIWQRTATTDANGTTTYSAALCITGVKGDTGDTGVGVSSIVPQWYLSTSDQTTTGGSWSDTQPAWSAGYYYWTRSKITYDDSSISYSTEILASAENSANSNAAAAVTTANAASQAAASATGISTEVRNKLIALCTDNNMTYIDGGVIAAATILANAIDLNNLFAQNIIATNFNITGGSIHIDSNSSSQDVIKLAYGSGANEYYTLLTPSALGVYGLGESQVGYYGSEYANVDGVFNGNPRSSYMAPGLIRILRRLTSSTVRNLMLIFEDGINIRDDDSSNDTRMALGKEGLWFYNSSGDMLSELQTASLTFRDGTGSKKDRMKLFKENLNFLDSSENLLATYAKNGLWFFDSSGNLKSALQNTNPMLIGNGTSLTANFTGNTGSGWTLATGVFRPTVNSDLDLGSSSYKWKQIYSIYSTISTSDRREKNKIRPVPSKYLKLFDLLEPVVFHHKGGDRVHIGFISQDVEKALEESGMTAEDFAGFCKDVKKTPAKFNKKGKVIKEEEVVLNKDGNPDYNYGLRYEEFIALNTAKIKAQEKQMGLMEGYIKALEDRIASLESKIIQ